jgi:sugar phosphate isomerase/epimerase
MSHDADRGMRLELGLMLSHTCNITCRHCGILSSPSNRNRMSLELARRCIREAADLSPAISTIVFTGGEPMLFAPEIEELVGLAYDLGLSTRIVTNGFWARPAARGRALLHRLRLAGLDTLNFSADKFHLEFLPAAVLREAIALAQELGYAAIVNFVVNRPGDPVDQFCEAYGVTRDRVRPFRESEFRVKMREGTLPSDFFTKVHVSAGRLIAMGRAAEHPDEHYLSPTESFRWGACDEVVNRPVLYPDGDLQACCCAGGKIAEFTVGSLHAMPLAALIERMRGRSHYRFINVFGPRQLYDAVCAAHPERHREQFASICDMCVAATAGLPAADADRVVEHWALTQLLKPQEQDDVVPGAMAAH